MLNIAIFVSGRCFGYKDCLIPILNNLKTRYNIYLFLSINSVIDNEMIDLLQPVKYCFKKFFYEDDWIENRINNNCNFLGSYNQLSCFYNDYNNYLMIDEYEKENNITFDVISKIRSDMVFSNISDIEFIKDNEDELILNSIELECSIKWYGNSPIVISDTFCYGNKRSMKIYCNTYHWIKQKDIELKGKYDRCFEAYLNENIYGSLFYDPNNDNFKLTYDECKNKMENNLNNIKQKNYYWKYNLLTNRRDDNYKNQPIEDINIKDILWKWKYHPQFPGLVRE